MHQFYCYFDGERGSLPLHVHAVDHFCRPICKQRHSIKGLRSLYCVDTENQIKISCPHAHSTGCVEIVIKTIMLQPYQQKDEIRETGKLDEPRKGGFRSNQSFRLAKRSWRRREFCIALNLTISMEGKVFNLHRKTSARLNEICYAKLLMMSKYLHLETIGKLFEKIFINFYPKFYHHISMIRNSSRNSCSQSIQAQQVSGSSRPVASHHHDAAASFGDYFDNANKTRKSHFPVEKERAGRSKLRV